MIAQVLPSKVRLRFASPGSLTTHVLRSTAAFHR
jgi:hypothetical protein